MKLNCRSDTTIIVMVYTCKNENVKLHGALIKPFHVLVVKNNCWMNTSLLLSVNLSPSLKCLILKDAHTRLLSVLMTGNGKYILLLLSNTLMRFCALDNGKISQVYIKRSRQICQIVRAIPEILTKLDVKYL